VSQDLAPSTSEAETSPPRSEPERGAPEAPVATPAEAAAARERAAEAVAPNPVNGIGSRVFRADQMMAWIEGMGWNVRPDPGTACGVVNRPPAGDREGDVDVGAG